MRFAIIDELIDGTSMSSVPVINNVGFAIWFNLLYVPLQENMALLWLSIVSVDKIQEGLSNKSV